MAKKPVGIGMNLEDSIEDAAAAWEIEYDVARKIGYHIIDRCYVVDAITSESYVKSLMSMFSNEQLAVVEILITAMEKKQNKN